MSLPTLTEVSSWASVATSLSMNFKFRVRLLGGTTVGVGMSLKQVNRIEKYLLENLHMSLK